ncbi:MAG TPA: penicillin-binding protein 2 [Acidimicrobiales bacterium]|nr:penicillin-binding protein 2 [Acidimicrobiales bacterium]
MTTENSRLRLAVLGVVVISLFAALFARLWYLQVLDSETFQLQAEQNEAKLVFEEAPRGRILDRQGRVLVDNRVSEAITVNRVELKGHEQEVIPRLAALLGISEAELVKRIADPRYSHYKPVPVAEDVPEEKIVYLKEHRADFPGVDEAKLARRSYPNGTLAAHLLGYVGEINDTELKSRDEKGYRLGESIGKSGVEQSYEEDLRGEQGITKLQVDSSNRVLQTLARRAPVQGHDVQLTIDLDVQRLAEESLVRGLEAARRDADRETKKNFVAPAGSVVVLDPNDGSVLAMASYPTYDPASFVNGISPDVFRTMQDPASYFPLNNRVVQGQYAPGSTFKLVTATAAMRKGLVNERTTFDDHGELRVGNRTFRNAGSYPWGRVNVTRALAVSSDVYFYTLGASFWNQRSQYGETVIQDTAKEFGLGEKTGIPLASEARGRISDPEGRKRLHEARPDAFPEGRWFAGDNVNLSIGQGETVVTPLQLGVSYAAFANGGTVHQPKVAARILRQDGTVVREVPSVTTRKVDLPANVRTPIVAGLRGAITDPKGTAHGAFAGFDGFPVAGKTGTAQVTGKQDTAIFAGFGPANAPQYAISVIMEESGFGGSVAAPVARRIFAGLAGKPVGDVQLAGGVD